MSRVTHIKITVPVLYPKFFLQGILEYDMNFDIPKGRKESDRMMRLLLKQMKMCHSLSSEQQRAFIDLFPNINSEMLCYFPDKGWVDYAAYLKNDGFSVTDSIIYKISGNKIHQFYLDCDAYEDFDDFITSLIKYSSAKIKKVDK